MRMVDYDRALEREAEWFPERAEEIGAERARIAGAVAAELEAEGALPADLADVDALVAAALAESDAANPPKMVKP